MTKFSAIAAALALTLASSAAAQQFAAQLTDPVLNDAVIKFKKVIELPTKESGVLVQLKVKEGDVVRKDDLIAQIDDSQPQMQKKAADFGRASAYKKAKDDIEIQYATKQAGVAKADFEMLEQTNKIAPKAVTEVELRKGKLDWDRSELAIQKAAHEQELAKFEYFTKGAEFDAAELAIARRKIVAPMDGEIIRTYREQDEWSNPGDPIVKIAQRDTMRVESAVEKSEYDQNDLAGCDVSVEIQSARGQKETVHGRIVYVSPEVRLDGKFLVRAEVDNPRRNGIWLLSDGQPAKMTIHLNQRSPVTPEVSRVPK